MLIVRPPAANKLFVRAVGQEGKKEKVARSGVMEWRAGVPISVYPRRENHLHADYSVRRRVAKSGSARGREQRDEFTD